MFICIFHILVCVCDSGITIYDSEQMLVYHASLDHSNLHELFASKWSAEVKELPVIGDACELTNQLAVLQYTLINSINPDIVKQVS